MLSPLELELQIVGGHHVGVENQSPGPLQEQYVFITTELSPASFFHEESEQFPYRLRCLPAPVTHKHILTQAQMMFPSQLA